MILLSTRILDKDVKTIKFEVIILKLDPLFGRASARRAQGLVLVSVLYRAQSGGFVFQKKEIEKRQKSKPPS